MADLLTAKTLDEVVNAAAGSDQPALRPLVDLLPIAGGSGTLSNRFVGGNLVNSPAGWLRAKTGSLTKTNSLAGIVTDADGRVLTFTFISNNAGIEGRTAIDALAATLLWRAASWVPQILLGVVTLVIWRIRHHGVPVRSPRAPVT